MYNLNFYKIDISFDFLFGADDDNVLYLFLITTGVIIVSSLLLLLISKGNRKGIINIKIIVIISRHFN